MRNNGNQKECFGRHHCGQGRGRCENKFHGCGNSQGKGKRRELFLSKYSEYIKSINLPEFDTDEQYCEWVENTAEGNLHKINLERINKEVEQEIPWGGQRNNAGRKKECIRKIPYTRRISTESINILKEYSQKRNITETEALEKAISKLSSED